MGFAVVNEIDRENWREFVDSHPSGNVFHTPEMFEVYKHAVGYKPALWAVVDNQEIMALHTPVSFSFRRGVFQYLTTRNVNFGSVLVRQDEGGKKALALLLEKYNQSVHLAPLYTELRHNADTSYFQDVFQQFGYQYEGYLNYFIDLDRDEYDILQSFSRTARKVIRSAIRKGHFIVKEISEPEMLPIFYELINKSYTHFSVPVVDFSLFQSTFDLLVPKKMARFTISFANGVPAAASVTLNYKDVVYGWYGGMDRELGTYYPSEMDLWDSIQWGTENGYKVFDFGGLGKPDRESGMREFKLKFRGNLIEYGRNICVHSPMRMKLAETTYNFSRRAKLFIAGLKNKLSANRGIT